MGTSNLFVNLLFPGELAFRFYVNIFSTTVRSSARDTFSQICRKRDKPVNLLPTGSEERRVLGVGSIPVTILPSCQYMKILYYNCTDKNIVG